MKISSGFLTLIAILAVGYAASGKFRNYVVSISTGKAPSCLEILNNTTTEEEGHTFIIGSLRNNCDRSFGNVTTLFKLDRTSGPLEDLPAGVAYAYSRDVKAGEIREFKTALPVSSGSTYRFDGINAF